MTAHPFGKPFAAISPHPAGERPGATHPLAAPSLAAKGTPGAPPPAPGATIHPEFAAVLRDYAPRREADRLARDTFIPEDTQLPNDLPHFADMRDGGLLGSQQARIDAGNVMARALVWAAVVLGVVFVAGQVWRW